MPGVLFWWVLWWLLELELYELLSPLVVPAWSGCLAAKYAQV